MDVADFEQDILKLAFETDVRITTASVAYYLGIPSTQAEPMLEELLERGVLELDSDREGNLYYRVVDAARRDTDQISRLRQERVAGVDGEASGLDGEADPEGDSPATWKAESLGDATVEDVDAGEVFSPEGRRRRDGSRGESSSRTSTNGPSAYAEGARTGSVGNGPVAGRGSSPDGNREANEQRGLEKRSRKQRATRRRDHKAARNDSASTTQTKRRAGVASHSDDLFAGVTRERGARDASLDTCGDDEVIVQSEAQCEPRPLADADPVVASCAEETGTGDRQATRQSESTGLIERRDDYGAIGQVRDPQPAGAGRGGGAAASLTYRQQHQLDQPEHQPGMSLLLSLILCGTGQIYNGEVSKGIMMMVLCFLLWFVLLGWVVHIWSIVDSVVVAERINRQSGNN